MSPAPVLLYLLIITTPVSLIFDGPISYGLITAVAAISVAVVALRIRRGETEFLLSVIKPVSLVAAIPALWMVMQVLPLGFLGIAHPIWQSAATTLELPIAGSISIDPGATIIALTRYLSMAAIALVAATVAIDRYRAGWILSALTVATTLIAVMLLATSGGIVTLPGNGTLPINSAATDCAALGIIIAVAAVLHTFERGHAMADLGGSVIWLRLTFAACLIAYAICCLALILGTTGQAYFAVGCGIAVLAAALIVRYFGLGPWGISAVVSVALVVVIATVLFQSGGKNSDLMLSFATGASAQIALTQRILADTPWAGTGAGTFAAVLSIYRSIDELGTGVMAPAAMPAIAVEMGRPFLWIIVLAATGFAISLLRGAARRRRDLFYSIAGASSVVTITLLGFGNAGLLSAPVGVIMAAIVGLAVAQSKSRAIR